MWAAVGACALGALVCLFAGAYFDSTGGARADDFAGILYRSAIGLGLVAGGVTVFGVARLVIDWSRRGPRTRGRVGRHAVRDRLTNRLRECGTLMGQRPRGAEELRSWIGRVQSWFDATYAEIQQHVSAAAAMQFADPRMRRRHRKYMRAVNEEHNDWLGRLDEWRERLRDVIGRL